MSTSTRSYDELNANSERKVVVSNQEITTRKWKFDSIFKVLIGIVYGLFFGILPASFLFTEALEPNKVPAREVFAILSLLLIGVMSIVLIFWSFKGDIKKFQPLSYAIVHLINGIFLFLGIFLAIYLYPETTNLNRYFILAITYLVWALVMVLTIAILLGMNKKKYPLTWSKFFISATAFIFLGVVQFLVYLSANAILTNSLKDQSSLYLVVASLLVLLAILVFGFGIAFIRRYRDVLLGERTEYEISTIRDWESSRLMSIIAIATTIIVYSLSLIWSKRNNLNSMLPIWIEVIVDAVLVIPYIFIISRIKVQNIHNSNKSFYVSKIFKPIDNGLMLDVFAWIILVKATLLNAFYFESGFNIAKSIVLVACGVSLIVLYGFNIVISVNIPNLRNTAVTIPTLAFALIGEIFIILFAGYLQALDSINSYVFIFMLLIPLVGISISLIIKIFMIAKIFKVNWKTPTIIDKTYLAQEQDNQEDDLIGERTAMVDVDGINTESNNEEKPKTTVEELRSALNEANANK